MRNVLFLLGGGILVYLYMCNSKKHKCNCEGDLLNDLTKRLNTGLEKAGEGFEQGIKDAEISTPKESVVIKETNKPSIVSTGVKQPSAFQEDASTDISSMDKGVYMKGFNRPYNFSSLYKRYNTSKSATISPDRVNVIYE